MNRAESEAAGFKAGAKSWGEKTNAACEVEAWDLIIRNNALARAGT